MMARARLESAYNEKQNKACLKNGTYLLIPAFELFFTKMLSEQLVRVKNSVESYFTWNRMQKLPNTDHWVHLML